VAKHYGREAWKHARDLVSGDDGLPAVETSGIWTARKLFFLCVYLEQTTRAMFGHPKFPGGLAFLDLFSGSGVTVVRTATSTGRYPGSSVIAASLHEKPFAHIISVDADASAAAANEARVRQAGYAGHFVQQVGDANVIAPALARLLPIRALNIAFVDPFSLDVHYRTIETLARSRPLDLIILFSDRLDLGRNVEHMYYPRHSDKLDLFLGNDSGWRKRWESMADRSGPRIRAMFAEIYCEQLTKLGYVHHRTWPLEGPNGPMFRLVFASKNSLGLKFCEIALNESLEGDRGLWGMM
jgi:three-Cys-motif partner protein